MRSRCCFVYVHTSSRRAVLWRERVSALDDYLVIVVDDDARVCPAICKRKKGGKKDVELNSSRSRRQPIVCCVWFLAQAIKLSTDAAMHRSHQMSIRLCWVNLPLLRFIEISAQCCWLTKKKEWLKESSTRKWNFCFDDFARLISSRQSVDIVFHPSNYLTVRRRCDSWII